MSQSGGKGIPLDQAELLSVLFEGTLYGFSLLMFGGTIWALWFHRFTRHVNYKMLSVACLLLLVSTTHFAINIIRLMEGFVLYRNTYQGGPIGYFSNVSQWTSVSRQYVFTLQTLFGDGVALYRCYVVWEKKPILILPVLLWCAVGVAGFGGAYLASREDEQAADPDIRYMAWISWSTFWTAALVTSLSTTFLLVYRIWYVDRKAKRVHGPGRAPLRHLLHAIVDAGAIYSIALVAALISYLRLSHFQYGMIVPIISITFYMVIIRVGLANRAKQRTTASAVEFADSGPATGPMQVHITTLTECKVDHGHAHRDGRGHGEVSAGSAGDPTDSWKRAPLWPAASTWPAHL